MTSVCTRTMTAGQTMTTPIIEQPSTWHLLRFHDGKTAKDALPQVLDLAQAQ